MRKVVRRGKGTGEEGVQEVSVEGSLQDANELELDAEQFMSYAILGRDSSKVGFWSAASSLLAREALQHLRLQLLARMCREHLVPKWTESNQMIQLNTI